MLHAFDAQLPPSYNFNNGLYTAATVFNILIVVLRHDTLLHFIVQYKMWVYKYDLNNYTSDVTTQKAQKNTDTIPGSCIFTAVTGKPERRVRRVLHESLEHAFKERIGYHW